MILVGIAAVAAVVALILVATWFSRPDRDDHVSEAWRDEHVRERRDDA